MPRKVTDETSPEVLTDKKETKKVASKKVATKNINDTKATAKKTTKKAAVSKTVSTKANDVKTAEKKTTTKKAADTKSSSSKKSTAKKTDDSKATAKKAATKKTTKKVSDTKTTIKKITTKTTRKTSAKKSDVTSKSKKIDIVEYYDLPYRYNQTVVKVLYQTPTTLFVYWDISDDDRASYVEQFGPDFFNNSKPVLIIHNDTMNYSFEIDIDDFANSWYLNVNDANCEYRIELGRRSKYYNEERFVNIPNNYLYIAESNEIESPNDHILLNTNIDSVYFRDVKNNSVTTEKVTPLSYLKKIAQIYSMMNFKVDFIDENKADKNNICWKLDLKNPSSANPSSTFR